MFGRFSALSVSDSVIITSVFNGTKTKYLLYKDGLAIMLSTLSETPTDERNGLEVLIYYKENETYLNYRDADVIKKGLSMLTLFDNLYCVCSLNEYSSFASGIKDCFNGFNERKIKQFKTFNIVESDNSSVGSRGVNIAYGKVQYPLRIDNLPSLTADEKSILRGLNLNVKIPIGELEITPNREEILYSTKTTDRITSALKDTLKELSSLVEDSFKIEDESDEYLKTKGLIKSLSKVVLGGYPYINATIPGISSIEQYYPKEGFIKAFKKNLNLESVAQVNLLHTLCSLVYPFKIDSYKSSTYGSKLSRQESNMSLARVIKDFNTLYIKESNISPQIRAHIKSNNPSNTFVIYTLESFDTISKAVYKRCVETDYKVSRKEKKQVVRIFQSFINKVIENSVKLNRNDFKKDTVDIEKKAFEDKAVWGVTSKETVFKLYMTYKTLFKNAADYDSKEHCVIYCTQDTITLASILKDIYSSKFSGKQIDNIIKVSNTDVKHLKSNPYFVDVVDFFANPNEEPLKNIISNYIYSYDKTYLKLREIYNYCNLEWNTALRNKIENIFAKMQSRYLQETSKAFLDNYIKSNNIQITPFKEAFGVTDEDLTFLEVSNHIPDYTLCKAFLLKSLGYTLDNRYITAINENTILKSLVCKVL